MRWCAPDPNLRVATLPSPPLSRWSSSASLVNQTLEQILEEPTFARAGATGGVCTPLEELSANGAPVTEVAATVAHNKLLQTSAGGEWEDLKRKGQGIIEWGFQRSIRVGDLVGSFTAWSSALGDLAEAETPPPPRRAKGSRGGTMGKKAKKGMRRTVRGAAVAGEAGFVDLRSAQLMAAIMAREHHFRLLTRLTAAVTASDEELAMQLALGPQELRVLLGVWGSPRGPFASSLALPVEPACAATDVAPEVETEHATSRAVRTLVPFDSFCDGACAGGLLGPGSARVEYASFLVTELHRLLDEGVSLSKPFLDKKRASSPRRRSGGKKKRSTAVSTKTSPAPIAAGASETMDGLLQLGKGFSRSLYEAQGGLLQQGRGLMGNLRASLQAEKTRPKHAAPSGSCKKHKKHKWAKAGDGTAKPIKRRVGGAQGVETVLGGDAKLKRNGVKAAGARSLKAGGKREKTRGGTVAARVCVVDSGRKHFDSGSSVLNRATSSRCRGEWQNNTRNCPPEGQARVDAGLAAIRLDSLHVEVLVPDRSSAFEEKPDVPMREPMAGYRPPTGATGESAAVRIDDSRPEPRGAELDIELIDAE